MTALKDLTIKQAVVVGIAVILLLSAGCTISGSDAPASSPTPVAKTETPSPTPRPTPHPTIVPTLEPTPTATPTPVPTVDLTYACEAGAMVELINDAIVIGLDAIEAQDEDGMYAAVVAYRDVGLFGLLNEWQPGEEFEEVHRLFTVFNSAAYSALVGNWEALYEASGTDFAYWNDVKLASFARAKDTRKALLDKVECPPGDER